MKFHILTPFVREQNKKLYLNHIAGFAKNYDVRLHLIIDKNIEFPNHNWIEVFTFTMDEGVGNMHYHKYFRALNIFLTRKYHQLVSDDYYMFLNDDDFVEPDFFEKLKGIESDFIVVSMKRGDNIVPTSGYGTHELICTSRVMGRRGIGGEQLILKGRYLKGEQFRENLTADGEFIGRMWSKYPHRNFTFIQDAYVWFNYLEPGRWESAKKLLDK